MTFLVTMSDILVFFVGYLVHFLCSEFALSERRGNDLQCYSTQRRVVNVLRL